MIALFDSGGGGTFLLVEMVDCASTFKFVRLARIDRYNFATSSFSYIYKSDEWKVKDGIYITSIYCRSTLTFLDPAIFIARTNKLFRDLAGLNLETQKRIIIIIAI